MFRPSLLVAPLAAAITFALPASPVFAVPTFATGATIAAGTAPTGLTAGDADDDGTVDLVSADPDGDTVSFLAGNGHGRFAPRVSVPLGGGVHPVATAIGDVNGDGLSDIVAADSGDATLAVVPGRLDGSFGAPSYVTLGGTPSALVTGDMNGDGRDDLIATDSTSGSGLWVVLQQPDGTLAAPTPYLVQFPGAASVDVADLDDDGDLDVVVVTRTVRSVAPYLNLGDGSLLGGSVLLLGGSGFTGVAIGDVMGDDDLDVVAVDTDHDALQYFEGHGDGTFEEPAGVDADGVGPSAPAIADLDDDGLGDVAAANAGSNTVGAYYGVMPGQNVAIPVAAQPSAAVAADFDGDGRVDVAATNAGDGTITVARNASAGAMSVGPSLADFATTPQGELSAASAVTVTNPGNARLRVTGVAVVGADPDDFVVSGDGCTGVAVRGHGGTCTVRVRFAPSATGARAGVLRIAGDQAPARTDVALSGTGGALPEGPQGEPGPQGQPGTAGTQGPQGTAGTQGPQGTAGTQGPQGEPGAAGSQGAAGSPGDAGAAGAKGDAGTAGAKGDSGGKGDTGPAGTPGATGPAGPAGKPGRDAKVTCTTKTTKGKPKTTCRVTYPAAKKASKRATARLVRDGRTYATGTATTLHAARKLPRGRYTLTIRTGRATTTVRVVV